MLEREEQPGGVPRHADHLGFGVRDMRRLLSGPAYARRYAGLAADAGVEVRTSTSVIGWAGERELHTTSPGGLEIIEADALVLATGCRERPRSARLVPGDRPLGIFTTGSLQQLVHLRHERVGRRAVIVGAEHVSFSAVLTLVHGGCVPVAMVTEHPRHQTYPPYRWLSAGRHRVPVLPSHRVTRIVGARRVEAVEVTDLRSGESQRIDCDTVVFTGDWIPDHELARRGGLEMDPATRAPRVDAALRTSRRGVFGAGNLLHAAETADVAALGGRHAAAAVQAFLRSGDWPEHPAVPIVCEPPVQWVSPSAAGGGRPPRGRFLWRCECFVDRADLVMRQGPRVLWRGRYRRLVPALPLHAPAGWIDDVDPAAGQVVFSLERR